jgi:hypothetical protein
MVTRAVKYTIAARTIQRDLNLGIAPSAPTVVYTDASAVLGGQSGDHMAKSSRWMATRHAMIRWAERCKTVRMAKRESALNCGDIMTKCLTGVTFARHRATVLGMPELTGEPDARATMAAHGRQEPADVLTTRTAPERSDEAAGRA